MSLEFLLFPTSLSIVPDGGGGAPLEQMIRDPVFQRTVQKAIAADAALDAAQFGALFGPQASFQLGGLPKMVGAQAVTGFISGFFQSVRQIEHRVLDAWELPDTLIYRAEVTLTKPDGRRLTGPYVNVLKFSGGAISEYQVFIDLSTLN